MHARLNLPPASPGVVSRQIIYTIDAGDPVTIDLAASARETAWIEVEEGDVLAGTLIDTDGEDADSDPRAFSFTCCDTFGITAATSPPPMPAVLGIAIYP